MSTRSDGIVLHRADRIEDIPPRTFYGIARLRQEVFVVEQACVYLDLDGRDLEPGAIQLWAEPSTSSGEGGEVIGTVRILDETDREPGLRSIGRVVTARSSRGRGIAARLLNAAIEACEGHPVLIHAQSQLAGWYAGFGFAPSGEEFVEDGIPHTPMRRE
ncbi:GNAT family N-acetyltransferase [Leucobacter weissii]|uniref:GNAT family N-acetyltransferase n=1 Tax=Leucobacter weissii TaxID=1983706 RepID=A0A939S9Y5_9MICO|nr:GNAT family N-acetyltransferase [Leucobacter weissii]MBO1901392.1 GNAT family N-acetyltransferase [Leucobacter weissii]